jgi:uncharacterized Zn-finger protein
MKSDLTEALIVGGGVSLFVYYIVKCFIDSIIELEGLNKIICPSCSAEFREKKLTRVVVETNVLLDGNGWYGDVVSLRCPHCGEEYRRVEYKQWQYGN